MAIASREVWHPVRNSPSPAGIEGWLLSWTARIRSVPGAWAASWIARKGRHYPQPGGYMDLVVWAEASFQTSSPDGLRHGIPGCESPTWQRS